MNWLDIILLLLMAGGVVSGFKNGLIGEIASLAALVFGIWGAVKFSGWTGQQLTDLGIQSQYMHIIAFVVTFIVIVILIQVLAKFLNKTLESLALGFVNRLAGIVVGILKSVLILSVLLLVLDSVDDQNKLMNEEIKENSLLYEPMVNLVPSLLPFLPLEELEGISRSNTGDEFSLLP